ncbi:hypothetical protein F5X68DRAFT_19205 [Plectosphaerella plurivora]|uniref:Uncharacterized protein n=1 Tax=Plectosphaerella plurivora TaxID=936078 RepID=A0A9P8V9W6_9PEZI|nr:hypothetical protein F5X68DRAFT_19205 [Plectosphaerella plurivora]
MSRNETAALTSCSPEEPIGRDLVPESQKKNHGKAVVAFQNSSTSQALSMTTVKALAEGVLLAVEIECIATVHRKTSTADRSIELSNRRLCHCQSASCLKSRAPHSCSDLACGHMPSHSSRSTLPLLPSNGNRLRGLLFALSRTPQRVVVPCQGMARPTGWGRPPSRALLWWLWQRGTQLVSLVARAHRYFGGARARGTWQARQWPEHPHAAPSGRHSEKKIKWPARSLR